MRRSKRRKLASLDAMDVATRFVNAANQHDSESLIGCVHRDFQSIQPVHPDRNFRGVAQLRNNWEAIFRTEPGFRLTVLRSTATDDTVWMELHGAGDDEEAAGTFILGIEDGRIRWIRVYSDIVEPATEPPAETPLSAVPDEITSDADTADTADAADTDETVEATDSADHESEWAPQSADDAPVEESAEAPEGPDAGADVEVEVETEPITDGDDTGENGRAESDRAESAESDEGAASDEGAENTDGDAGAEPPRRRFRLLRGKAKA